MFSYLLGYTSACICQCCGQHCLCLDGVRPGWDHPGGFPAIKVQGKFSHLTCPITVPSAVFSGEVAVSQAGDLVECSSFSLCLPTPQPCGTPKVWVSPFPDRCS